MKHQPNYGEKPERHTHCAWRVEDASTRSVTVDKDVITHRFYLADVSGRPQLAHQVTGSIQLDDNAVPALVEAYRYNPRRIGIMPASIVDVERHPCRSRIEAQIAPVEINVLSRHRETLFEPSVFQNRVHELPVGCPRSHPLPHVLHLLSVSRKSRKSIAPYPRENCAF